MNYYIRVTRSNQYEVVVNPRYTDRDIEKDLVDSNGKKTYKWVSGSYYDPVLRGITNTADAEEAIRKNLTKATSPKIMVGVNWWDAAFIHKNNVSSYDEKTYYARKKDEALQKRPGDLDSTKDKVGHTIVPGDFVAISLKHEITVDKVYRINKLGRIMTNSFSYYYPSQLIKLPDTDEVTLYLLTRTNK